MDTKEKSREEARKRKARQEAGNAAVEKPFRKTAGQRAADPVKKERPSRRDPEKPRREERRRRTENEEAGRREPRKRTETREPVRQDAARRREGGLHEPRSAAVRQAPSSVQRPVRTDGMQVSAPQGTGFRKSAPKLSAEETEKLRRQQRSQPARKQETKKNALQSLISGIQKEPDVSGDLAERAARRQKQRSANAEKKRKAAQRYDTPAVIYTQPQVFNRDRLLIQLLSVVAVVAAMVVGMSVFFKVETVTVAGAETYSAWAVREASGIKEGDSLLTFSKARAIAKVHAELSYVDNVRIGIKLPDTVIIYIEELDVAYAVESTEGDWWLINSQGRIVDSIRPSESANYTQITGVLLQDPQIGLEAVAANEIPEETLESGEPVPVTVTGAQRLSAALQILQALEANDIVGEAASVDLSALDDITLWYGSRYEVLLGEAVDMEYKIACMNDAILELSEYQSGILDVSFTTWTDQVGYTPFG